MSWGQRAAILKQAKNQTAAKLYLNWRLSTEQQQAATNGWSVRTDVTPPTGLKPIWQYPNGNLDGFPRFMADRAAIERWKQTFALYLGEVEEPVAGLARAAPGSLTELRQTLGRPSPFGRGLPTAGIASRAGVPVGQVADGRALR